MIAYTFPQRRSTVEDALPIAVVPLLLRCKILKDGTSSLTVRSGP